MSDLTHKPLLIREWPKMIFLWPTALACLILSFVQRFAAGHEDAWGMTFLIVFGLNLLVLTFEFPRGTSLTVSFICIAVGLGLVLLNQRIRIIAPIAEWINNLTIHASTDFYWLSFIIMLLLFIGMFAITRFDYWELTANELIHHHGLLGDVERFSTAGLKLNKEITDIFEYILAGAGRIIVSVPSSPRPIILENVLRIGTIEKLAGHILDAKVVRVEGLSPMAAHTHSANAGASIPDDGT